MLNLNTTLTFQTPFLVVQNVIDFKNEESVFLEFKANSLPNHFVFSEFDCFYYEPEQKTITFSNSFIIKTPLLFEFKSGFEATDPKIQELVLKSKNFFIAVQHDFIIALFNLYFDRINVNLKEKNHVVLNSFFNWITAKQIIAKSELEQNILKYVP